MNYKSLKDLVNYYDCDSIRFIAYYQLAKTYEHVERNIWLLWISTFKVMVHLHIRVLDLINVSRKGS